MRIGNALRHLFVEDGNLAALAGLLILGIAGGVELVGLPRLWGGALLVVGLAAILLESLGRARTGRKS